MYQPPPRPDPWADRIAGIAALRGMLGESTIKETSSIGMTTRVWMPLVQTIAIGVGFVLFSAGAWGLMDGLIVSFDADVQPAMYLLLFVVVVALLGGISYATYRAFLSAKPAARWVMAIAITLFVLTALVSATLELRAAFDLWRFLETLVGAGVMLGSGLLVFHQILNVVDPYWRTSPAERELLAMWRNQPDPVYEPARASRIPYRHGGRRDDKILVPEPDEVLPEHSEYELLDFLELSQRIGLARSAWISDAERRLKSTGAVVDRRIYDRIIAELVDAGYVIPGGDGKATRWAPGWDPTSAYNRECESFEETWGNVIEVENDKNVVENN